MPEKEWKRLAGPLLVWRAMYRATPAPGTAMHGLSGRIGGVWCMETNEVQNMNTTEDDLLLSTDQINKLTGRKMKCHQIAALRAMGIPFFVNATGHPVVARCVVEGKKEAEPIKRTWIPKVLKAG